MFELLGKPARSKTCEAIQGLNAEMAEVLEDFQDSPAADAALIGAAQAVEHYEIARYGTLKTWAGQLGMTDAAKLLEATLAEEKKTDELLTQLAETSVNPQAGEDDGETPSRRRRARAASASSAGTLSASRALTPPVGPRGRRRAARPPGQACALPARHRRDRARNLLGHRVVEHVPRPWA